MKNFGFYAVLLIGTLMSPLIQAETDCTNADVPKEECDALVILYDSTDGPNWTDNTGWNDSQTVCEWYGVFCDGGNVSELYLSQNGLSGSISSELSELSQLTVLDLSYNMLNGSIPANLGDLSNLQSLALNYNMLNGSIPASLGNLSNLQLLALNYNRLEGVIPSEFENLSQLVALDLSVNSLNDSIPSQLGSLSNLGTLYLSDNELCGEIPVTLQNLPIPEFEIPFPIVPPVDVPQLDLDNNHLTIPSDADLTDWLDARDPDWDTTQSGSCPESGPGTLQFSSVTYEVNEGDGSVGITVTRVNGKDGAVSVDCISSDGSATAGSDYTAVSETLSWGDQDDGDKTCIVEIIDDDDYEGNETFSLTLENATGGATIGSPDTAAVTIVDTCPPLSTLQFSSATYDVGESDGTVTITVTRVGGSCGGFASVKVVTGNGTAKKGKDFEKTTKTLKWDDGEAGDKTFTVDIIDDSEIEGDETFKLKLKKVQGADLGNPAKAEVTIVDNDAPTIQFSKDKYQVNENAGTVAVTVTISEVPNNIVVVEYSTSDGSATEQDDYLPKSDTLRWEASDGDDKIITVDIIDDGDFEDDEAFNLMLYNPFGATIGDLDTTEVTIVDNDGTKPGTLQFSSAMYDVSESDGTVTISVTRVGGSSGAASVKAVTSNGTAKKGKDFEKTTKTLKWDDGEAGDKTFTVDILDDNKVEGDETFKLKLKKAKGAELSNPKKAEVTIIDDDGGSGNICNEVTEIPTIECEALVALYESTDGANWSDNTDWNVTNTPCDWKGVTCDSGHVSRLYLYNNNLNGEMPPELGDLSGLERLLLSGNVLSGAIPHELGNLSQLQYLWLQNNDLCGDIPETLMESGIPSNIGYLKLDNNHLETDVSDELGAWLDDRNPTWDGNQTVCPAPSALQFNYRR
jgi:Leucine-rich repeat (LRR) protein